MKIEDIKISNISRFRAELMGMAMLFIILFHVALPQSDAFFGLRRMGNLGVDMFLFLSGVGLWFSWMKMPQSPQPPKGETSKESLLSKNSLLGRWGAFYWRRLKRVYPTWLIIACLYYIPRDISFATGKGWCEALGDILINWDFWLHDEGTFWYIPATMMLYIFAPPYMELIRRHPVYHWLVVAMMMWCVAVQWVTPLHNAVGHIEIFWSRVPIFFLGINVGEMVKKKETIDGQGIWLILILFTMSLGTSIWLEQHIHGHFPLFIERMLYIPLTVTVIILLNYLFCKAPRWFNKTLAWIGTVSLEIYLIHAEFVLKPIEHAWHLGYWPTFLLTVIITMPIAWLLHIIVTKTISFVTKKT